MKLLKNNINLKDNTGSVVLVPEQPDDLWHVYNLLQIGDHYTSTTFRRVKTETENGVDSNRKKIVLTIVIEQIEYNAGDENIRLGGKNVVENQFVKLGAFHTMELELNRKFTLAKPCWDSVYLDQLEEACNPAKSAEVGAVLLQEGLCNICIISGPMTIGRGKVEVNIPRKRAGNSGHDKALEKFFENILNTMLRSLDFSILKVVLIASPGFYNAQFFDYMMKEAVRKDLRVILENKDKFLVCHSNSAHRRALREVLTNKEIIARLSETKAAREVAALEQFYTILREEPERAFYGFDYVIAAHNHQAIDTLLMTDELFRSRDPVERRKYVDLLDSVKANGGTTYIFSTEHVSGEQLKQLTGIAAITRFPLNLDIEVLDDEDDYDE